VEKVRLALVLITIAITVGPILGMVLVYRDNLSGLVVPPEINEMMNSLQGNPSEPGNDNAISPWESIFSGGAIPENISEIIPEMPGPEDVQYDPVTRTFTASFQMKNPMQVDMTLNSISGTVECDEHHFPIGPIQLKNPVTLKPGETGTVAITGRWTEKAIAHLGAEHPGQQAIQSSLVDAVISYSALGMTGTYQSSEPISLGEIPLTGS
jgi:uncharacterized protein YneF (UPF0154 family)